VKSKTITNIMGARGRKALSLLLVMLMIMSVLQATALAAPDGDGEFTDIMAAGSTVGVLDLSDDAAAITAADLRFAVSGTTIIVSGPDPVTIQGDGTTGGWSIQIDEATDITIAAGAIIDASLGNALSVPDGAVIMGMGGDISITARDNTTYSVQNNNAGLGGSAIYSAGSLTIVGELGDINACRYGIVGSGTELGGEVNHTVSIPGTVGNITVKNELGDGYFAYGGIAVHLGNIIISGDVGDIESCGVGIEATYDITISGRVGDITVVGTRVYSGVGGNKATITEDAVIGNITSPVIGIQVVELIISGTIGTVQGGILCDNIYINNYVTVISNGNALSSMNYAFSRRPVIGLEHYTSKWSEDVSGVPFDGANDSYPWSSNHKWVQISEPPVIEGDDAELLTSDVSLIMGSRQNVYAVFYDNFGALEGAWDDAALTYSVNDALGSEVKTGTAQRIDALGSTQVRMDFDATTPAVASEYAGGEYLPVYTITLTANNGLETVSAAAEVYLLPPPVVIEPLTNSAFVFLGQEAVFDYALANLLPGYSLSSDKGEVSITNEETANGLISLTARVAFTPATEGAHYITFSAGSAYGQDSQSVTQTISAGDSSLAALNVVYKDGYDGSPAEMDIDDNDDLILYGMRESTIAQLFSAYGADNQQAVYEALSRMWQAQSLNVVAPVYWGAMTVNGAGVWSTRFFDSKTNDMPQTLAWANVDTELTFTYQSDDLSDKLRAYKIENGIDAPVSVSYTNGKGLSVNRTVVPYDGFIFLYDADGFSGQIRLYQSGADSFRYCVENVLRGGLLRNGTQLGVSVYETSNPTSGGTTPFAYTSVYMLSNPMATFRPFEYIDGSDTLTVRYGVIGADGSFITGTGGEINVSPLSPSFNVPYGAMYENPDSRLMVEYDFGRSGDYAKYARYYDLKTLDRAFKNRSAVSFEYQGVGGTGFWKVPILKIDPEAATVFGENGASRNVSLVNSALYLKPGEIFEFEYNTGGRLIESASVRLEQWRKRTDTGEFDYEHWLTTDGKVTVKSIDTYGFTPNNYAALRFDLNETLQPGNLAEVFVDVVFTDGTKSTAYAPQVKSDDGGVTFATEQKVLEILEGYKFFNPDEMYMDLGELDIAAGMEKYNNQGLWEQGKPWNYVEPEVAAVYGNIKVPYAIPSANPFEWDVTREGDEYIVRGYVDAVKMNDGSWRNDFGSGAYEQTKQETLDAMKFYTTVGGKDITTRTGDFIQDEWPGIKGYLEGKAVISPEGDVRIVFNDSYVLVDSAFQYVP